MLEIGGRLSRCTIADASYTDLGGTLYSTVLYSGRVESCSWHESTERCLVPGKPANSLYPSGYATHILFSTGMSIRDFPPDNPCFIHRLSRKLVTQRLPVLGSVKEIWYVVCHFDVQY